MRVQEVGTEMARLSAEESSAAEERIELKSKVEIIVNSIPLFHNQRIRG